jgi:hypothetical protein
VSIPILFVGFNRPELTLRVLKQFRDLPRTQIFFSIDKAHPANSSSHKNMQVIDLVIDFQKTTHHETRVLIQAENVGCNQNTLSGMDFLLSVYPSGVLIEDDCEFRNEYIQFLNGNFSNIDDSKFFSVTPMNLNWSNDLANYPGGAIGWSSSTLMGASLGMTFSRESKREFDLALPMMGGSEMQRQISRGVEKCPLNFIQKTVIESFFHSKSSSIRHSWDRTKSEYSNRTETGWDSAWQLAAFYFGKEFLLPNYTLARETLDQDEDQWHKHQFNYPRWNMVQKDVEISDFCGIQLARQRKIGSIDKWDIPRFPIKAYLGIKYFTYTKA